MLRRILGQATRAGKARRGPGVGGKPGPGPGAGRRPRRGGAVGGNAEMQRGAKSLLRGFSKRRKGL